MNQLIEIRIKHTTPEGPRRTVLGPFDELTDKQVNFQVRTWAQQQPVRTTVLERKVRFVKTNSK